MQDDATVELIANGLRIPVRRDVAMAVFARAAMLTDQHRVETVELPVDSDAPAVVHLLLGSQPISLIEAGAVDPGEALAELDTVVSIRDDVPATSIVPDFAAYADLGR